VIARRTIVVHTKLANSTARVDAARKNANGLQIFTMDRLAARLAGGFLQPIDDEILQAAVVQAISSIDLGELEAIKTLPGMVRAAITTLGKAWQARIDLNKYSQNPRLQALAALEREVICRLPPSMKRSPELVDRALARITHAKAIFGPIEVHGHSEMAPVWRPLLDALSTIVPVTWVAGPRPIPAWLDKTKISIQCEVAETPTVTLYSCANPQHEVLEALRWARSLLANGSARPEEIAIAAASPAAFDDQMMALAREANLPLHFTQGVKALTRRDGQAAAALADTLIKGISQERVRRLFALLNSGSPALKGLLPGWTRLLPPDASLTTYERWTQTFAQITPDRWPEGADRSTLVLGIVELLAKGPAVAREAGEKLFTGTALQLWRRALREGPAQALPITLTELRVDDGLEPATSIVWTSARSLASAPRPYARLLALNTGRWPRGISEDRLIPDHIIPIDILDPLPIADADRRDFATIRATTARSVALSFSRRDVEGRLLGRSPLIAGLDARFLSRGRIPDHAASEVDRLLARPNEFSKLPIAISAKKCWQDWYRPELTGHDGLIPKHHPRIDKIFASALSATSLKLLLRDPIRFVWHYAFDWRQPEEIEEPLTLDAMALGNFVHGVLEITVNELESESGLSTATPSQIEAAVAKAIRDVAESWETEQPVPPAIVWRHAQETARDLALKALGYPLTPLPKQTTWTEVPFGAGSALDTVRCNLPWTANQKVEIPGTGLHIRGRIDRLDISGDETVARVIDYKTGRLNNKQAEVIIDGGNELQRCLYAFAVKTLINPKIKVEAALLFSRATDGKESLFSLANVNTVTKDLAHFIALARINLEGGLALPGIDAGDEYNDLVFALPANAKASYLARKEQLVTRRLGEFVQLWERP
jgi:hypothetical protein